MYSLVLGLVLSCTAVLATPSPFPGPYPEPSPYPGPQPAPAPFQGGRMSGPSPVAQPRPPQSGPSAEADAYRLYGSNLGLLGGVDVVVDPYRYDLGCTGLGYSPYPVSRFPGFGFGYNAVDFIL
ncbi:lipid transfer protein EARLI 1-like [Homalodisca vitripennis]|uniref:lipid transfer protein EARLI 1-like n=1 Tax=Homalodisca vitripennis TaxID=197043 RepID=UPI001EE9C8CB|nr:lipid transfer protein EARLI 1-like [Homalodisca vitripennis]KAG8242170.1 hypothetical protein J6590_071027 [Homalodisca vitripennis]